MRNPHGLPKKPILIIQGGCWGSESKGAVAHALAKTEGVKWAIRTGSINAGHSAWHGDKKLVFQQLPTASVLEGVNVVIGPGAYVNPGTLLAEMEMAKCSSRLYIDGNCGVHLDDYAAEAAAERRNLRIGATGKGCAEAIIHKIKDRGVGKPLLLRDHWDPQWGTLNFCDSAEILGDAYDKGDKVLLEGTQGTLLDFHCGPYPFVTSRQTIASAWVTEAGLSPALDYEVALVVRTCPIRVAGNSGPMANEISWPELARRMNKRLAAHGLEPVVNEVHLDDFERNLKGILEQRHYKGRSDADTSLYANTEAIEALADDSKAGVCKFFEMTTVTKRVRRIADLDVPQLALTVKKERPKFIALTFLNYVYPEIAHTRILHPEALAYINGLEREVGCEIRYVNIGPKPEDLVRIR